MTEVEEYFLDKCIKKVTNRYNAINLWKSTEDNRVRQWYRHPDLDDMSKEAFDNGEDYFYCDPKVPQFPHGRQIKSEPKYVYECHIKLTVEEYEELKNKCK